MAEAAAWRVCVAPMMRRTDRHFRHLCRLIAPRTRLYTEMLTADAVIHGPRDRLLRFDPIEHPVALQLGGSEPEALARAARIAAEHGYDEVNLNCGCPSERVQSGRFGACLMREPALVAEGLGAMREALPARVPATVKLRLGVDELYAYGYFRDFVATLASAGTTVFHVHARKAWLSGLSPRENREIPPLEYGWVYRLKREMPDIVVVLNGGITAPASVPAMLAEVDGVMIGRQAYADPGSLAAFERAAFGEGHGEPDWPAVLEGYLAHTARECAAGSALGPLSRHLLNLFQGRPGARRWRRHLTEHAGVRADGPGVIRDAYALLGPPASRHRTETTSSA